MSRTARCRRLTFSAGLRVLGLPSSFNTSESQRWSLLGCQCVSDLLFLLLWRSIPSGFLVEFEKPNRSSFTFSTSTHFGHCPCPGPQEPLPGTPLLCTPHSFRLGGTTLCNDDERPGIMIMMMTVIVGVGPSTVPGTPRPHWHCPTHHQSCPERAVHPSHHRHQRHHPQTPHCATRQLEVECIVSLATHRDPPPPPHPMDHHDSAPWPCAARTHHARRRNTVTLVWPLPQAAT